MAMDFGIFLDTSKVLDARRRGATTEAYEQYAAGTSLRHWLRHGKRAIEGNAADDILMVDQGSNHQWFRLPFHAIILNGLDNKYQSDWMV